MSAAQARASLAAHGVDLIDEDDGRGLLLGLGEEVPDPGSAHAHVELHEVGAGDGEEGHPRLVGHGLGEQGLAGARRAHQKHALGDACPQGGVLLRIPEEVHDLAELLLLLVRPGHGAEADAPVGLREGPDPSGAELCHAVLSAPGHLLGPEDEEIPEQPDAEHRDEGGGQGGQPVHGVILVKVIVLDDALLALLQHQGHQVVLEELEVVELMADGLAALKRLPQLQSEGVPLHREALDLLLDEELPGLGIVHLGHVGVVLQQPGGRQGHDGQQQHDPQAGSTFSHLVYTSGFSTPI